MTQGQDQWLQSLVDCLESNRRCIKARLDAGDERYRQLFRQVDEALKVGGVEELSEVDIAIRNLPDEMILF